jgi:O-antigen ligase
MSSIRDNRLSYSVIFPFKRDILLDLAVLGLIGFISFALDSKPIFGMGIFLWLIVTSSRPIRLLFIFCLFYPFTFVNHPKVTLGSLELGFDDFLLMALVLFVVIRSLMIWTIKRGLNVPSIIPKATRMNVFFMFLFALGVLISSLLLGRSLSSFFTTIGWAISLAAPVLLVRNMKSFYEIIGLLKVSAFLLAIVAILISYGVIDPVELEGKIDLANPVDRSFLGAVSASTGLIGNRGSFGINIAFIIPFVITGLLRFPYEYLRNPKGRYKQSINIILLCSLIVAVAVSGSRSTWINIGMVFITFFSLEYIAFKRPVVAALLFFFFIAIFVSIYIYGFFGILEKAYNIAPSSVETRILQLEKGVNLFTRSPIFGVEHNIFWYEREMGGPIHNFFLSTAVKYGLIGVIPVILIFANTVRILRKNSRMVRDKSITTNNCLTAGFVGMLIELMFYPGGEKLLWLYIGMITIFIHLSNKEAMQYKEQPLAIE